MSEIRVGASATCSRVVTPAETAEAMGSGALPVLATPALVALMEAAACACLVDALAPGQTSVGTHIAIDHLAASPVGAMVTARATVTAVEGRRISFDLAASDDAGEIGCGRHSRAIVEADRLVARAQDRHPTAGPSA